MLWTVSILSSSFIYGLITAIERRLLTQYLPTMASFYIWIGISQFLLVAVLLLVRGIPTEDSATDMSLAYLSGLIWAVGLMLMFWGLKLEEASRVTSMFLTYPVFVAILALVFLGETVGSWQWVGIVSVVVGAILVSTRGSLRAGMVRVNRSLPILISASVFVAIALTLSKHVLDDTSILTTFVFRLLGMVTATLPFFVPANLRGWLQSFREPRSLAVLMACEFFLAHLATYLVTVATNNGPVSLVATLAATRPFFVFVVGAVLSVKWLRILDEPVTKETILQKATSMALIIGGIGLLQLG